MGSVIGSGTQEEGGRGIEQSSSVSSDKDCVHTSLPRIKKLRNLQYHDVTAWYYTHYPHRITLHKSTYAT